MRIRAKVAAATVAIISMFSAYIPARADVPVVKYSATITDTSSDVILRNLTGQSSCSVEIVGTAAGTTQGVVQGAWALVNSVQLPDGGAPSSTVTGPGTFTANCANMASFKFHPTSVTGTATVTISASAAVGRIIGAGVNGGRTILNGAAPITVTNSGNTTTVGLTTPLTIAYGGTNTASLPAGCLTSDGTTVISGACPSAAPQTVVSPGVNIVVSGTTQNPIVATTNAPSFSGPLSALSLTGTGLTTGACVQAGLGGLLASVAAPCGSVTSVGAGTNIVISGSSTAPVVNTTNAPSFTGTTTVGQLVDSGLTSGNCVQASASGLLTTVAGACGTGSGTVTAVTGSGNMTSSGGTTPNVTITDHPTFGQVTETNLFAYNCVVADSGKVLVNGGNAACGLVGTTNASFVIPAVGSPVSISLTNGNGIHPAQDNIPMTIGDGTHVISGWYNSSTDTFTNEYVALGSVGNTMATGALLSAGSSLFTSGTGTVTAVTGSGNVSSSGGTTPNITVTAAPTFGQVTDSGLTSGNCVQASTAGLLTTTASACGAVQSVAGTGNVASTGGPTPAISLTGIIPWANGGTGTSSFTNGRCVTGTSGTTLGAASSECLGTTTSATFVVPAVGSTVSVTPTATRPFNKNFMPVTISDGTHSMMGLITAGANSSPLTVQNLGMLAGIVGDTMASAAVMFPGSGGSNTSITGTGNITVTAAPTPVVSITAAPTFGQITDSGLTSGNCVQASTAGLLTTTAAACGTGTVTSVAGTGNISSTGGTAPTVSITAAPTFSGSITSTSTGSVLSSTNGYIQLNTSNSSAPAGFFVGTTGAGGQNPQAYAVSNSTNFYTSMGSDSLHTVATVPGTCLHFAEYNGVTYSSALASLDCSGNMGIAGVMHATSFTGSGAGLTSGTVPNASLVTAPVTSVTGSGNMASSGGTTPNVTITNTPTFTGALSASTLTASSHSADSGNCVQFGVGGILGSSGSACGGGGAASAQYVLNIANFSVPNFDYSANRAINASQTNATATNDLLKGATIKTISVTCVPFQAADPNTPYSIGNQGFDPTVTGIKGGVLTLQDYGASGSTTIGTLTLADSAAGGPYVNHATTTLGSPYTVPTSDVVFVDVSGTNAGASSSWQGCLATVGV